MTFPISDIAGLGLAVFGEPEDTAKVYELQVTNMSLPSSGRIDPTTFEQWLGNQRLGLRLGYEWSPLFKKGYIWPVGYMKTRRHKGYAR